MGIRGSRCAKYGHLVASPLWKFMRHSSTDVAREQKTTQRKFDDLRNRIAIALKSGTSYPWALYSYPRSQRLFLGYHQELDRGGMD